MRIKALGGKIRKDTLIRFLIASLAVLVFSLTAFCDFFLHKRDITDIKSSGKLRVILAYDPINYFIYKGTPMGYSYELAERFAKHLGVGLEVILVRDMNNQLPMLRKNEGDLIAHYLTVTEQRSRTIGFSIPLDYTHQVLVQRKKEHRNNHGGGTRQDTLITESRNLDGKRIHVREKSAYYARLKELEAEHHINVRIIPVEGSLSTSDLIRKVDEGRIDYTVADDNIAYTHKALYPDLDFSVVISPTQALAWAVRKNSPGLLDALNRWIEVEKTKSDMRVIHYKYYRQQYVFKKHAVNAFYSKNAGSISSYDDLIKQHAKQIGWDWRLLSSLIYEESQFRPAVVSWAGAIGLMQVMPGTAAMFSIKNLYDPHQNIKAGTAYLSFLEKEWQDIPDPEVRLKFILASYNVGPNHVRDAQMLARKYGKNPHIWEENVEKYLALKSKPVFYNDEVTKFGYCNGIMPVKYAQNILTRYNLYAQVIPR